MATTKKLQLSEAIQQVVDRFEEYRDTTGAILDDYVADPGMITELAAADENFIEDIKLLEVEDLLNINTIVKALDGADLHEEDTAKILAELDDDYIRAYANGNGDFILVRCSDGNVRRMVEEFLTEKVYPNYNDQQAYLTM